MAKVWENSKGYFFLRPYVDWCTRRSFSYIHMHGKENIPTDGAVILAPNHCNTLMDALVVLQADKQGSSFGARADIFKKPKVASLLRFLKILPMARMRDGAEAVERNLEVFDEVIDIIDHDMPFCIYSEGTHHTSHSVHQVRKGIWRIAKSAQEKLGDKPVYIVPVGLDYEDFFRYCCGLDIRFGEPIRVSEYMDVDNHKLVEMLRERIQDLIVRTDEPVVYKHPVLRTIAGVLMLPFFLMWAVLSSPMWLASTFLGTRLKDKAWMNTVRYACKFVFLLLYVLALLIVAISTLNWWVLALLPLLLLCHSAYYWHIAFYQNLFQSYKSNEKA